MTNTPRWKLVPIEPDGRMEEAGKRAGEFSRGEDANEVYRAMLESAPQAEGVLTSDAREALWLANEHMKLYLSHYTEGHNVHDAVKLALSEKPISDAMQQWPMNHGAAWLTNGADLHPLTANLVVRFARALASKLSAAEKKYGYSDGWRSPDWMDECRQHLAEHVAKGDPRDVAAYCAFLWHHGESTSTPAGISDEEPWVVELRPLVEAAIAERLESASHSFKLSFGQNDWKIVSILWPHLDRVIAALSTQPSTGEPTIGNWIDADDVKRLARTLDVAVNGDGAASAPSLCDVVSQVERLVSKRGETVFEAMSAPSTGEQTLPNPPTAHDLAHPDDGIVRNGAAPSAIGEQTAEPLADKAAFDRRPWKAGRIANDVRVYIDSEDFTHDVRLYVTGDFESFEQKLEYANFIAGKLNTHPAPAQPSGHELKAAPTEFVEYVKRHYSGEIVISSPKWHADRLYRAAIRATPSPEGVRTSSKPLSDGAIDQLLPAYWMRSAGDYKRAFELARAIESAHGITAAPAKDGS